MLGGLILSGGGGISGGGGFTVVTGEGVIDALGGVLQANARVEIIIAFFMAHFLEKLNGYTIIAFPPAGGSNCRP